MQKTDFLFNVIIADDCSSDGTLDIIKRCTVNSDVECIILENEKNLGAQKNFMRAFKACNAEYIATMEGDDLWIASGRLQHHVDFLDIHLECSMSSNRRLDAHYKDCIIESISPQPPLEERNPQGFSYLTAADLIRLYNGGMNVSSCVYRKSILDRIVNGLYAKEYVYEAAINIMASICGLIARHDEIMNVYRVHKSGIWAGLNEREKLNALMRLYDVMDEHTEKKFDVIFAEKRDHIQLLLNTDEREPSKNYSSQEKAYLQQAPGHTKELRDSQALTEGTIFLDTGSGFNEGEKIILSFKLCENNRFSHYVEIPPNVKAVRFDPIEGKACMLKEVEIISNNGKLVFKNLAGVSVNGLEIFKCTDPQILIETEGKGIYFIKIEGKLLTFNINEMAFVDKLDELATLYFQEKNEKECIHQSYLLEQREKERIHQSYLLEQSEKERIYQSYLLEQREIERMYQSYYQEQNEKQHWYKSYLKKDDELQHVFSSRSWKITKPLRSFINLFKRSKEKN